MALHLGYVTRETAVSLKRNLLMTLAGILTVAVSLFLFGGVLLLSRMVDHGSLVRDEAKGAYGYGT